MALQLTDKKFGRLTVKDKSTQKTSYGHTHWNCVCDCGNKVTVISNNITSGNTTSCGCLRKEKTSKLGKSKITHEMSHTKTYKAWKNLIQRCTNSKATQYHLYGGRGIKVCDRWLNSFENFLEDMGPKPPGRSILKRIQTDGDYEPNNCKWITYDNSIKKNIN